MSDLAKAADSKWKSYEEVAAYLLNEMATHFDLERVEASQYVIGLRSGARYRIDARGTQSGGESFIIIECRRHTTSRQKQEQLAGLAYRIMDTGAAGGIMVSPLGLQEGAARIARAEKIISVTLAADSTNTTYVMGFLDRLFASDTEDVRIVENAQVVRRNVDTGEEHRIE